VEVGQGTGRRQAVVGEAHPQQVCRKSFQWSNVLHTLVETLGKKVEDLGPMLPLRNIKEIPLGGDPNLSLSASSAAVCGWVWFDG
jgi:hypothetical protein